MAREKQILRRCDCGWALWTTGPAAAYANHFQDGTHSKNMAAIDKRRANALAEYKVAHGGLDPNQWAKKAGEKPHLLVEGMMGRWVIAHGNHPGLAWSGSRWVRHDQGVPTGDAQVCNFTTREEAQEYVNTNFNAFFPPPITW
jgi:hypothetical protein